MRQFDRTLRVVMWLDAFLSAALAVLGAVASPIVAVVGLPRSVVFGLGLAAIGCALLLAAFGAITAGLLIVRMRAGQYRMPAGLRLPLPAGMHPPTTG
jgi:fucose permease